MKLFVGLGNPGPRYETTRHNAGALLLDLIADNFGLTWASNHKFEALVAKGQVLGQPSVLIKPLTFMNLSGRSVLAAMQFYKVAAADIILLHDDLDLAFGQVKARCGGGHGGHNGIRHILQVTGQSGFQRLKLGIGRPEQAGVKGPIADWVLQPFSDAELLSLQKEMYDAALLRLKGLLTEPSR